MAKEQTYIMQEAACSAVDYPRRAARANDLTKTQMAHIAGVSMPTLDRRFEDGDLRLSQFLKLAAAAGVKPSDAIKLCDDAVATYNQSAEVLADKGVRDEHDDR